jgi:plastocyanin
MAAPRTPLIVALATVTAACALFAVIAGVTSDDDDGNVSATPSETVTTGAGAEVDIQDFAFGPQEIQVAVGDTVTWKNLDPFAHSVRAGDKTFGSDPLDQGATFSFTFAAAGSFAYVCGIHPSMSGTVVVA